ncbi:MAG TPA: hypothetical protein ENI64_05525 [Gammaproteobacteria bacterium]|nr:hypothetical protein [Gammaproteobacteria bacterium]
MPYLLIQTNKRIDTDQQADILTEASHCVAEQLGKPESYVMVSLKHSEPMMFASSDAPLAYLELKSISLPENSTAQISKALCQLIHDRLSIDTSRIYIEFSSAERHMWGWNEATF